MAMLGEDERHEIAVSYGTIIGTGALAIVVCVMRLMTRKYVLNSFSFDDWSCIGALLLTTMFNAVGIAVVYNGAGRHITNVTSAELNVWFKLYYGCTCSYLAVACLVKGSLLALLWRLFPTPLLRTIITYLGAFMVLFTVSGSFVAAFQCNPPKYVYDLVYVMAVDRAEHCFSGDTSFAVFMYQAVVLFTIDIIILFLPVPALWGLKMSKGKGLVFLMVLGSAVVACIAPALRFQTIYFYKSGSSDMTFEAASSLYWMCIEYNLGMVAGSLGSLRPLLVHLGLSQRSTAGTSSKTPPGFSPSYPLKDLEGSGGWRNRAIASCSRGKSGRIQGDSVLERTCLENGSQEHIVKTQEVKITYTSMPPDRNTFLFSPKWKTKDNS